MSHEKYLVTSPPSSLRGNYSVATDHSAELALHFHAQMDGQAVAVDLYAYRCKWTAFQRKGMCPRHADRRMLHQFILISLTDSPRKDQSPFLSVELENSR